MSTPTTVLELLPTMAELNRHIEETLAKLEQIDEYIKYAIEIKHQGRRGYLEFSKSMQGCMEDCAFNLHLQIMSSPTNKHTDPVDPKGPRDLPNSPRASTPLSAVPILGIFTSPPNRGMDQSPRSQSIRPLQSELKGVESARELEERKPDDLNVEDWKRELKGWMSDMQKVYGRVLADLAVPFNLPWYLNFPRPVSHIIKGPQPDEKRPTFRGVEIFAFDERKDIEEVDRWIEAARELELKGKDVKEWKEMLQKLLVEMGAVPATIIEVGAMLAELHAENIYDDEPTPQKFEIER
ncbi:hypothetical protein SBOR_9907 [Sclerotinia borealis F-4128]|uniref:Uncharacterized protein n=1 Tax=Sclerotinia borealis (strain F-4128) TaxID=1432307 RepID=W9C1W4_SCLBF|nr:hypothetical protein SBOR_9907 [Sclerotinia borealis F-4128]